MITFNKIGSYGRLGNQMFQYALIYSVAKKNNWLFGVPFNKARSVDDFLDFSLPDGFVLSSAKDSSEVDPLYSFKETTFSYDKSVFDVKDDTDFTGFFQSYKYFDEFKDEISEEFSFKKDVIDKAKYFLSSYSPPFLAVGIRRGPFNTIDGMRYKKVYQICRVEYFKKCFEQFPNHTKLIFTDEPSWCGLKELGDVKIVPQQEINNKFVSLCMMSLCDDYVISNSSFYWWAAWLNKNQHKRVFVPKQWFNVNWSSFFPRDPNPHWEELYCPGWSVIENSLKIF